CPSANAAAITGWTASRRIHPTALAAAAPVTRVCHRSHIRADPCPSSSYPSWAVNAARNRAPTAVCLASARSSARNACACTGVGSEPTSAAASATRARSSMDSASATLAGSCSPHTLITSRPVPLAPGHNSELPFHEVTSKTGSIILGGADNFRPKTELGTIPAESSGHQWTLVAWGPPTSRRVYGQCRGYERRPRAIRTALILSMLRLFPCG